MRMIITLAPERRQKISYSGNLEISKHLVQFGFWHNAQNNDLRKEVTFPMHGHTCML